eukprot:GHUV01026046.1.p2 GENE.GHUV01026046.1~~GHUV01026046.1.p2  ORF type:complete len:148 (-),score=29.15 GHUV01026046.1:651-1094(-)
MELLPDCAMYYDMLNIMHLTNSLISALYHLHSPMHLRRWHSPYSPSLPLTNPFMCMHTGQEVLKVLRTSIDLSGSPIVSVACHPGGHQLIALTKACSTGGKSKGMSDLVVIDMKLLLVARRLGGVKCCSAPLKFGVSPGEDLVMVAT